jgi:hypothetical protein
MAIDPLQNVILFIVPEPVPGQVVSDIPAWLMRSKQVQCLKLVDCVPTLQPLIGELSGKRPRTLVLLEPGIVREIVFIQLADTLFDCNSGTLERSNHLVPRCDLACWFVQLIPFSRYLIGFVQNVTPLKPGSNGFPQKQAETLARRVASSADHR